MTSTKQIEANRKNALASTGPKTTEGKLSASKNATRHGLFSKSPLVPGEESLLFENLRAALWMELSPIGICEESLVERIASYKWRLRRILSVEAGLLGGGSDIFTQEKDHEQRLAYNFYNSAHSLGTLIRYEVCIERMMAHAFAELRNLQESRLRDL